MRTTWPDIDVGCSTQSTARLRPSPNQVLTHAARAAAIDGRRTSTILWIVEQVRRARSDDGRLKAYKAAKQLFRHPWWPRAINWTTFDHEKFKIKSSWLGSKSNFWTRIEIKTILCLHTSNFNINKSNQTNLNRSIIHETSICNLSFSMYYRICTSLKS